MTVALFIVAYVLLAVSLCWPVNNMPTKADDSLTFVTAFDSSLLISNTRMLLFVVALWNRADHYIFILSFVLLLLYGRPM